MSRPWFPPLFWGVIIILSSLGLWFTSYLVLPHGKNVCDSATCVVDTPLPPAVLTSAGIVSAGVGIVLLLRGTCGIDRASRPVADQSMTTSVIALGIILTALGGAVGRWLTWIGIGVVLAGIGGAVRETLALRQLRREDPRP